MKRATAEIVRQESFDYRVLAEDDRAFVKERELLIRETAQRTAQGIVAIGQWLTEAKDRLGHGRWLPWLEGEFGWADRTARRFMTVYDAFKLDKLSDLEIDVSALYLVAAPSTPAPVREEVVRRAKNGEPMTRAKAMEVLETYEARAEVPTPAVARRIAIATGVPTAASDNTYVLPMPAKQQRELGEEQRLACTLYDAIELIAKTNVTPPEMIRLGKKFFCWELREFSEAAARWLNSVVAEAGNEKEPVKGGH